MPAALPPRRIPNVTLGLALFYGGVLSAFFWTSGFNFGFLPPWIAALVAGSCVAGVRSEEFKRSVLSKLGFRAERGLPPSHRDAFKSTERGIFCTLGPIPFFEQPLPRLQSYTFEDLLSHCPPELAANEALARLLGRYLGPTARKKHAAHLALFDALATTLLHPDNLKVPAGIDRHGGRSLLKHTLLVCALMAQRAPSHVYVPSHGLAAIDVNFKLDAGDPLIPILAMAHDLGKVRKMVYGEDGIATALLPGHDEQSAREVSRLPEFWAPGIAPEERRIIQALLSYYGHTADMPIQRPKNESEALVTSDRLHALTSLLAECDRLAGSIEMGAPYSFDSPPAPIPAEERLEDLVEPTRLFGSLAKFFVLRMPVNSFTGRRSVGFKRNDPDFSRGRELVIIDEMEFLKAFSEFLEKPELNVRNGKSSELTKRVLETLDENKVLFRFDEGPDAPLRPATSCLYKIEFRGDGASAESAPVLVLSSAFLIDVTDWPAMAKLRNYPNCLSVPSFAGFRLGRQPSKQRLSIHDKIAIESLDGTAQAATPDVTTMVAARTQKKSVNPEKVVQKIGRALFSRSIEVAASDEKALAVVGFDEFFRGLGLEIEHHDTLPETFAPLGILQINRSQQNPGVHVIRLDRTIYDKFVANTAQG